MRYANIMWLHKKAVIILLRLEKGHYMGTRKTRSDCTVGSFEKKHGLPPGTIRNDNGRDTRSDKKIGTIRKKKGK